MNCLFRLLNNSIILQQKVRKIMELNFNSVEMSRKPNAEASSLGYAEVPLTFNSVETIPSLNA